PSSRRHGRGEGRTKTCVIAPAQTFAPITLEGPGSAFGFAVIWTCPTGTLRKMRMAVSSVVAVSALAGLKLRVEESAELSETSTPAAGFSAQSYTATETMPRLGSGATPTAAVICCWVW